MDDCHRELTQLLRDAALSRVRRRMKPRAFQMYDLYASRRLPLRDVAKFSNATPIHVQWATMHVKVELWRELARFCLDSAKPPPGK